MQCNLGLYYTAEQNHIVKLEIEMYTRILSGRHWLTFPQIALLSSSSGCMSVWLPFLLSELAETVEIKPGTLYGNHQFYTDVNKPWEELIRLLSLHVI
jgi:hypothetical protein